MAEQVKYVDSFHVQIGSHTYLTVRPVKISVLIMAVNSLHFLGYMSDDPHDLYCGQGVMSLQNLFFCVLFPVNSHHAIFLQGKGSSVTSMLQF